MGKVFIGTAGWSIASRYAADFPVGGTHLERYGRRLACVEIDTSFYREHKIETYERWAASVPADFRFSIKLPKAITHEKRLVGCGDLLARFFSQANHLGEKLGVVVVQTPPNLVYEPSKVDAFVEALRAETKAPVAIEPRHETWFDGAADAQLERLGITRIAADPARFAAAGDPGGSADLAYFRLHGSPRIYYSDYPADALDRMRLRLDQALIKGAEVWCILDNTAEGHALGNALSLARHPPEPAPNRSVEADAT